MENYKRLKIEVWDSKIMFTKNRYRIVLKL